MVGEIEMSNLSGYDSRNLKARFIEKLADELTDVDFIAEVVSEKLSPEDVFKASELEQWAEENGYVKEE